MSFNTSLSGLKSAQADLDVIAHNIANAETTGFKRSRATFADIISASITSDPKTTIGIGSTVQAVNQNMSSGPIEQTGGALDLAISGEGFFASVSQNNGQTYFTRSGNFSMDGGGFITDNAGNRLQMIPTGGTTPVDAQVPLANATGSPFAGITIDGGGKITATFADGSSTSVGNLALASFVAPRGLKPVGSANWLATGLSGSPAFGAPGVGAYGTLMPGALERSNVDIAEELVNLISAQRFFQANAKAVDASTQVSQSIINLRS